MNSPGPTQGGGELSGWRAAVIGRRPKVTLARALIFAVVCVVVFKFVWMPIRVEGISMFPTYHDGSIHFINRLSYVNHTPRRGDVVGLRLSGSNTFYRTPGVMYMKRIVGLPGEQISFHHGILQVNGVDLAESYLRGPCHWDAPPVTNGMDQYFVVGDNRSMPIEDHYFGRVERGRIVGSLLF